MIKKFDGLYKLVFVGLLTNSLALAQDVNRLESIYITDEIESTSNQQALDLGLQEEISEEDIASEVAQSLDDIVKNTLGATTKGGPRALGETLQIRGLESNKIFINVDGVKQSVYFSNHNYSYLAIDPDTIKKVEVFKSNTDYSQGISLGGGFSFVTKDGGDYLRPGEKMGASLKYSYEEASRLNAESIKTYGLMDDGDYLLGANLKDAKNIALSDGSTLENSAYENFDFMAKFNFKLNSRENLKLTAEKYQLKDNSPLNATLDPPSDLTTLQGSTKVDRESVVVNYTNKSNTNKYLNLKADIYASKQINEQTRDSDGRVEQRNIETFGARLKNRLPLYSNQLTLDIGGDFNHDNTKSNSNMGSVSDYPDGEIQEVAAYSQLNYKKNDFSVTAGLRLSDYQMNVDDEEISKISDNKLSSSLLFNYHFKGIDFFTNYTQGFNSPDVQEVYAKGLHRPGDGFFISDNYFVPNYNLRPEHSKTLELGFNFKKQLFNSYDLLTLRATKYWSHAKDYIEQEVIDYAIFDGKDGTTQFVNRDRVSLEGHELGLSYLYDQVELKAGFARSEGYQKGSGLWLENMPADTYNLGLNYYLDQYGLKLGYELVITEDQNHVNPNTLQRTIATEGYTLQNIYASKEFLTGMLRGLTIHGRVDNLADIEYMRHGSYLYEVGQNFKFSIQYKIKLL